MQAVPKIAYIRHQILVIHAGIDCGDHIEFLSPPGGRAGTAPVFRCKQQLQSGLRGIDPDNMDGPIFDVEQGHHRKDAVFNAMCQRFPSFTGLTCRKRGGTQDNSRKKRNNSDQCPIHGSKFVMEDGVNRIVAETLLQGLNRPSTLPCPPSSRRKIIISPEEG